MGARKKITIEGRELPYDQGEWVVWNPQGTFVGCMSTSAYIGDDVTKAARSYFDDPIRSLNEGYRIELILRERLNGIMREAGWIK